MGIGIGIYTNIDLDMDLNIDCMWVIGQKVCVTNPNKLENL